MSSVKTELVHENKTSKRASSKADDPSSVSEKRKNKVWLWFLSSPGTSWVSIHSNKLFSCLKNTARFISIIQNGIKHRWYIIKHIHFFSFFSSQSLLLHCSEISDSVHLPLTDGLDYFPCCSKSTPNFLLSEFHGFSFSNTRIPIQEANAGTRGYNAGRLFSGLIISLFFFLNIQAVFNHAIQIWTHADRKVWHCMKSAKMYSFIQS